MMRSFILFLVSGLSVFLGAQGTANYSFTHIDQTDGLSHNTVQNIGQDSRGFIWILTLNGLQRYDGYRFVNYPDVTRQSSFSIIHDSQLYVDTAHQQVYVIKGARADVLNLKNNKLSNVLLEEVLIKRRTSDEELFSRNENDDQYFFDDFGYVSYPKTSSIPNASLFNVNPGQYHRSTSVVKDPDNGDIWTHDFNHFLIAQKDSKKILSSGAGHPDHPLLRQLTAQFGDNASIRFLLLDSHRNLWISTWRDELMRYNLDSQLLIRYSLDEIKKKQPGHKANATLLVQAMYEDRQGNLWIGTDFAGLLAYDRQRDDFDFILSDDGKSNGLRYSFSIFSIFQDRNDNLWVGTDRGINIFNPYKNYFQILRPATTPDSLLSQYSINDVIETTSGDILIATWGGGISVYDKDWKYLRNIRFQGVTEHNLVWSFVKHDDGTIWAGTQQGYIHQYDPVLSTVKTIHPEVFESSTIIMMTKDQDGNILFGLHNGKIVVWNKKENEFYPYRDKSVNVNVRFPSIENIFVDASNRCWVATGSGLREFDIAGRTYVGLFLPDSTDANVGINFTGIEAYNDSLLMIGTFYRGLYLFNVKSRKFSKAAIFNSLNHTSVFALKKDELGNYWFTTDYGLIKMDPRRSDPTVMNLDHTLMHEAFNAVGFSEMLDGRWMTTSNAEIFSFDPRAILSHLDVTPAVHISGFRVFDQPVYIDSFLSQHKPVVLSYDDNFITIEFSTLDFADVRQTNYVYRLTGINKDWIRTSSHQMVEYTDLKPGKYEFEIKAEQGNGFSAITSFPILIHPPWWATFGFRISCFLVALFAGYGLFKRRIRQIRQKSELSQRVSEMEMKALRAQMNPHFIFNCLSSIDNLIQTDQKSKATDYLAKFASLIRAILENSKANVIPCWKDLDALKLYLELESLRWENKIICHMHVDPEIQEGDYKVPPLVIQPFVENAIHHGLLNKVDGVKKLDIDVRMEDQNIKYTIADNGVGRAKAAAYKKLNKLSQVSYGVQMTNERINLFNQQANGSVRITDLYDAESRPTGTKVEIWLTTQPHF